MSSGLFDRIRSDLRESQITASVVLAIIPIAFFTYLFHEFGHWVLGEMFGNDMTFSLNYVTTKNDNFLQESHALWSSLGGPGFTMLQALIFSVITIKTRSIYAYSMVFFAVFSRYFSILFGGFERQDEAGSLACLMLMVTLLPLQCLVFLLSF